MGAVQKLDSGELKGGRIPFKLHPIVVCGFVGC